MRPRLLLSPLVFALVLPACFGHQGARLGSGEIDQFGTHRFGAPPGKVFGATVSAMKAQGFSIAIENPGKRQIKTGRRLIRSAAVGGGHYAEAIDYLRQYSVSVHANPDGTTSVVAVPSIYAGEHDISGGEIWQLDGPEGERALWAKLFREIDEQL